MQNIKQFFPKCNEINDRSIEVIAKLLKFVPIKINKLPNKY